MTATLTIFDGDWDETLAGLLELGLGAVSARGAMHLAATSPRVFLGEGRYLRRTGTGPSGRMTYVIEEDT